MRPSCSVTAATQAPSATPKPVTAMPLPMSMYSLPSKSRTRLPWPEASSTGKRP